MFGGKLLDAGLHLGFPLPSIPASPRPGGTSLV
jgi:hypothetical protein